MKSVLHVGCGAATIEKMTDGFKTGDWKEVRFDINPAVRPDIVGTITDMKAVGDNSVDALYSSHNIEHVYAHEVQAVLKEFLRVLKPDGFAVITCPDIESVAAHVAAGKLTDPLYNSPSGPISALDILYGHSAAIARGETYMAHRTAFTKATLGSNLTDAGFSVVGTRQRSHAFDLWAVGTKGPTTAEHVRGLMRDYCRA
jgi:ubiquinone/menaquinone biosynthesis C-methylase UbiE